ncbi:MAG: ABC transporter ATP-binding protein [Rickettsiales bacterium]
MTIEPSIRIEKLTKSFGGVRAVSDVSFSVGKGEILGFLGPNGAGKSTTMRMACGYLRPDSGSASVCGFDAATQSKECRRHIGYLPEGGPLYLDMTADAFLRFIGDARGVTGGKLEERLDFVNVALRLSDVWYRPLDELSKGYRRRVALAQALLHDPEVLILDEPTDGLDPNQKREVHRLIEDMAKEKAVVLSTHILEEVERLCTRTTLIAKGEIVARGTLQEVRARAGGESRLCLSFRKALPKDALKQLETVKHVRGVEKLSDAGDVYAIDTAPGKNALAEIAQTLAERKIYPDRIEERAPSLQDAFCALTGGSAEPETVRDAA